MWRLLQAVDQLEKHEMHYVIHHLTVPNFFDRQNHSTLFIGSIQNYTGHFMCLRRHKKKKSLPFKSFLQRFKLFGRKRRQINARKFIVALASQSLRACVHYLIRSTFYVRFKMYTISGTCYLKITLILRPSKFCMGKSTQSRPFSIKICIKSLEIYTMCRFFWQKTNLNCSFRFIATENYPHLPFFDMG